MDKVIDFISITLALTDSLFSMGTLLVKVSLFISCGLSLKNKQKLTIQMSLHKLSLILLVIVCYDTFNN